MNELSINDIVKEIVTTKDNSYFKFLELTESLSNQVVEVILEELSTSFIKISEKYIDPIVYTKEETYYRYKIGIDCEKFDSIINSSTLDYVNYQLHSTENWIERKKIEINKILLKSGISPIYSTYHLKVFSNKTTEEISIKDKIDFFNRLKKDGIIDEFTKEKTFLDAFSGRDIIYQPKIVFLKELRFLCFLLYRLIDTNLLLKKKYSMINKSSLIFVKNDGSSFSRLASSFSDYQIMPSDFKGNDDKEIAENIELIIKETLQ